MSNTPYFSSRQRSTYTTPQPHSQSSARGNVNEMRRSLRNLGTRLSQVETRVGGGSINLKSSSPVSIPPPAASAKLAASNGNIVLQITNPQFKTQNPGNLPHVPIQHKIRFSSNQDFSTSDQLPIGGQTYYEISKYGAGQRKWAELSSSFDGKNFNPPQIIGPITT